MIFSSVVQELEIELSAKENKQTPHIFISTTLPNKLKYILLRAVLWDCILNTGTFEGAVLKRRQFNFMFSTYIQSTIIQV